MDAGSSPVGRKSDILRNHQNVYGRIIMPALLGKTDPHNAARQLFHGTGVVGLNGEAAIDVEAAMMPAHHTFDERIGDFTFGFEHFEHFKSKQLRSYIP